MAIMKGLLKIKQGIISIGVFGLMAFSPIYFNVYKSDHFAAYQPETYVYVCNGPSSKRYHYSQNCRGLRNCSTDLERTTIAEARRRGRTLCGWED